MYQVDAVKKTNSLLENLFYILGGSFLLAIVGNIAFKLPFSPVPIVFQNTLAMTLGLLLGSKRGFASVAAFIFQGAIGLPVFANLSSGFGVLLGPTAGYIIGYAVSAFVAGYVIENFKTRHRYWLAVLLGNAAIYAFGLPWLANFVGFKSVFALGFFPFILGDIVKSWIVVQVVRRFHKV